MRPRFKELELFVKDQGRRPSCSVFAVVSALELQNAEISGRPEKLSEEYLIKNLIGAAFMDVRNPGQTGG